MSAFVFVIFVIMELVIVELEFNKFENVVLDVDIFVVRILVDVIFWSVL